MVRRGLAESVVGKTIERARVLHPRAVRRQLPGVADFENQLADLRIVGALRRGKYLWLPLDTGDALLGHLGMSGQLLVKPRAAPTERHLRVVLELSEGRDLRFVDQRIFGGLLFSAGGAEHPRRSPTSPRIRLTVRSTSRPSLPGCAIGGPESRERCWTRASSRG